ncbi:MAG: C45 family autoproteolytic acyltransferase/hydolase [Chloroflexota bacterium]
MALPLVHLDGSPFAQGRQHGLALRDRITENLEVYFDRFAREGKLASDEVRARAEHFLITLDGLPYMDAMRGVADGADVDLIDVVVLNARYELLYYQYGVRGISQPDGCTSFAVLPAASANEHLLLGQNWDWVPQVQGAILHTREPDGLETLAFTEAGIVGAKIGLNSAGLGLAINGLLSTGDDWSRTTLPFHARCYEILRKRSLADAVKVIAEEKRACSTNFLLAQSPDAAVDIEAAPDNIGEWFPDADILAHANHFLDPTALGIAEPETERRPHTYWRLSRIRELIDARAPVSVGDLESVLRDHDNHPDGICRHENSNDPPEEWCVTVTSVIMDLQERSVRITDGRPCEHLYEVYSLPRMALAGG